MMIRLFVLYIFRQHLPRTKYWQWLVAIERYMRARSGSKYERLLTEELASIETVNSDTYVT